MKRTTLLLLIGMFAAAFAPLNGHCHSLILQGQGQDQNGLLKIERGDGTSLYKMTAPFQEGLEKNFRATSYDTAVFDLRSLSDSAYLDKYTFWQEVPVSRSYYMAPMVEDLNSNGRAELYGIQKLYTTPEGSAHTHIFEQDSVGIFKIAYIYPDSAINPVASYDIDQDSSQEVIIHTSSLDYRVYHLSGPGSFPTTPSFGFNPYVGAEQLNNINFGDFDRNGRTDVVYFLPLAQHCMLIGEYDPEANAIDTLYRFQPPDAYTEGFSVGDFDGDGKTDFVLGSSHGYVYVVECQGVHQYKHVWTGQVETYNAYLHMQTHDIDGNGKPEFWVGGDAYYNGIGETRYTCFEMTGVNSYKAVARIDLIGIFSFFAGNCFARDIDGDGREELFICLDQNVLILKFAGSPNHHRYQMIYLKHNEMAGQNSVYYGATMAELGGDGRPELLITMDQVSNNQLTEFTRIYRPAVINGIHAMPSQNTPAGFQLLQNYPSPFNGSTVIRFHVPAAQRTPHVRLTIYDILGREIKRLLNTDELPGEQQVRWNGTNTLGQQAGSGVYLIRLETGGFTSTVKTLLIK